MAISNEVVLGQDCTFTVGTASFSAKEIVNWSNWRGGFALEQTDFRPSSSAIARFVTPMERTPTVAVQIARGLSQTFLDVYNTVFNEILTSFAMTDFPALSAMTS